MATPTFGFTAQQIIDEGRTTWEDINLLKTWLSTQNLPNLSDEQIVIFLLSCLNEQEPARATIKTYYSVRNRVPEMFDERKIKREDLQRQLNAVELCLLPERTDDGCVVVLQRLYDTNYWNFEMGPSLKLFYMTLDSALHENPPNGLIIIMDMKGTGILHLTRFRLGLLKNFFQYLQEGLPLRLKNIFVLNTAYFIDKVLFLMKPFAKKEVLDMMVFHQPNTDMELFYEKCLPRRCLPEDYGGDLPSVQVLHRHNIDRLTYMESHFEAEELHRHSIR